MMGRLNAQRGFLMFLPVFFCTAGFFAFVACGTYMFSPARPEEKETFFRLTPGMSAEMAIEQIVREGIDIDARDDEGFTLLMQTGHNSELFDRLLEHGADPNAVTRTRSGDGISILMQVLDAGKWYPFPPVATVQKLIDHGANVNQADAKGRSPLMFLVNTAVRQSDETFPAGELFDCLLRAGADVNATDGKGTTALMAALLGAGQPNPHREMLVRKLIAAGIDVNAKNSTGDNALFFMFRYSDWLRLYLTPRFQSPNRELLESQVANVAGFVTLLLDAGIDLEATDGDGRTALMRAAERGCHLGLIRTLLERGANANARDAKGEGPLMVALTIDDFLQASEMDVDGLIALLDATDDASLRNGAETALQRNGFRSFHRQDDTFVIAQDGLPAFFTERLLARGGWSQQDKNEALLNARTPYELNMEKIELLVREGADINARNAEGRTLALLFLPPLPELKRLVELGLDVDARGPEGATLLTSVPAGPRYAWSLPAKNTDDAEKTHLATTIPSTPELFSFLLEHGANVHAADDRGRTCLHIARPGPSVRVLLDAGADPNAADADGRTPLHVMEDPDALAVLISAADVDRRDSAGRTPLLSWMQRNQNPLGIPLLLEAGADVTGTANDSPLRHAMRYSAERWAADDGKKRLPDMNYAHYARAVLQKGVDPNTTFADGQTPLIFLVRQPTHAGIPGFTGRFVYIDMTEMFEEALFALFDYGVDVDVRDAAGKTAWDYAREKGNPKILRLLKEAAEDIRYPRLNAAERAPLMVAAAQGDATNFLRLLKEGADPTARDSDGWTALAHAAWNNSDPEIVNHLVLWGADPNARDRAGKTPLMRAAWRNPNPEVVRMLLDSGARLDLRDATGVNALDIALAHDRDAAILGLFYEAGAKLTDRQRLGGEMLRLLCATTGKPESIRMLLEKGTGVDARDTGGQTALMKAVACNPRLEIVRLLIDAGADVNAKDYNGLSVLDYALKGNVKVYELLLEAGVDADSPSVWWSSEEKALMQRTPDQKKWGDFRQW